MKTLQSYFLILAFCMIAGIAFAADQESRLMRFPAIYGNQIIFSYAGDLYTVSSDGGTARKLTSDIGYEMFARFSPDGKHVAFTGQYDGNTEVFLIPAEGGVPERLTYTATLGRDLLSDRMGPNNIVMGWTPDGKNIIYRSRKQAFNDFKGRLFSVPVEGGLSAELPLSEGGFCSYSPDGNKLAFNRVFREFRTWKYYSGGMADDIWIFDSKIGEVKNITNNDAQDIIPMWAGDEIFFLSDRDRTMNLFVYNTKTGKEEKVTNFKEYDIKFPSIGGTQIIFENGGYLYKMNVTDKKPVKIPVYIPGDFIYARDEIKDASRRIFSGSLSPNGERVIFSARGELFNVPASKGITQNMTQTPGVHERRAAWSPDGKSVAYLSDESGEFEIYVRDQDGKGKSVQLTKNADTYYFNLEWSPDSRKIAWDDRKMRLRYVDVESKNVTTVVSAEYGLVSSFNWSPDSKWLTYSIPAENNFNKVVLYNLNDKKSYDVTDNWYESYSPSFSSDGKYLVFVSDRDFNPTYSSTEWNHAYVRMGKIYLAILAKETPSPLAPENDVVKTEKEEKKEGNTEKKDVVIDMDGLMQRIVSLPVAASNYNSVQCVNDKVYYSTSGNAKIFDLKTKKEGELGDFRFSISSNHKKMLANERGRWYVINLPTDLRAVKLENPVDVSRMQVKVNYSMEWKQIFDESWRHMRDFFYVENMHGVNWKAMHSKYAPLVPFVRHRDDLTYVIGEMIAELNVGHAYVNSGERPAPSRINTGLLGAKISRDKSGYFKVDKILKGANWSSSLRSPLTEVGVDVKEGDYIIEVDGNSVKETNDLYSLLVGKAGQETELTVSSTASESGARKVIILPLSNESSLYYYNWVQDNIEKVSKATNGEVGYIHIPDMGVDGLNEFARHFYPQLNKKGLIIDDRGNGGGNVSPMILERLLREPQRANIRRNMTHPTPVPAQTMLGPMILLMDKYSASDGDLFPWGFMHYKLGTTIGTRSWGGVVGISGSLPFIDGSDLRKPEFASYSSEKSEWIIEGYGVDPDIVLDNDPHQEYKGNDAQLEEAISLIKEQIKTQYKALPAVPKSPDKSK